MLMCVWCLLLGSLYFAVLFIYTICIHMCVRGVMLYLFFFRGCLLCFPCFLLIFWCLHILFGFAFYDFGIFLFVFSCCLLGYWYVCLVFDVVAKFFDGFDVSFFFRMLFVLFSFGWMFGIFSMFLLFFLYTLFDGFWLVCWILFFDWFWCVLLFFGGCSFLIVWGKGETGWPWRNQRFWVAWTISWTEKPSASVELSEMAMERNRERERDAFCVPAWEFPNLMQLEAAAMAVSRAPCIVMEVRCNCMSTRATVWQRNRFPKRTFSASFISFLLIWSLMNVIRINNVFPCEIMKCRMLMHKLLRKSKRTD